MTASPSSSCSRSADDGVPAYDHHEAAALTALGAAVLACTPDAFPDLLGAALEGRSLSPAASRP